MPSEASKRELKEQYKAMRPEMGVFVFRCVPTVSYTHLITKKQLEEIASTKMPDLNASNLETAISMIAGTCRSMGVTVTD